MRRIELFESFKDNWPPCGPFSSMEEVDKVCDELRVLKHFMSFQVKKIWMSWKKMVRMIE